MPLPVSLAADDDAAVDAACLCSCDSAWRALGRLGRSFLALPTFGALRELLAAAPLPCRRQRGLFPLGLASLAEVTEFFDTDDLATRDAADYVNAIVVGLNWLSGLSGSALALGRRSAAQRAALDTILQAVGALRARLAASWETRDASGWASFEHGGATTPLRLVASAVDVPDREYAGACRPATVIKAPLCHRCSDPTHVFPAPPPGLDRFSGFYAGDRCQYLDITVRQLRAGLLVLLSECRGGATVFPVGKTGGRQRLVWHGTRVSLAAAKPPAPRSLATPAVFGLMDLPTGSQLRVSKRDCRTWFDQLALEPEMRPFFGRPRVRLCELLAAGLSAEELRQALGDELDGHDWLMPCAATWPMGFSWSSCTVASATLACWRLTCRCPAISGWYMPSRRTT